MTNNTLQRRSLLPRTRLSCFFYLALWSLIVALAAAAGTPCGSVDCQNSATCISGSPNVEEHALPNGGYLQLHEETRGATEHCMCLPGWTGLDCSVPYESCDGSTHKCYHGGTCVLGLIDRFHNSQLYCNCDEAIDEDGTLYAGKYCENPAMTFCDDAKTTFCLNGGACNPEFPVVGEECVCLMGYKGNHCEYEEDAVPDCTLDCQNGGRCELGLPSDQSNRNGDYFGVGESAEEEFQYCECPDDFHGKECEISSNLCGDNRCFHGGECVERVVDGQTLHHCDCTMAGDGSTSYAGRFCQYEATEICSKVNGLNGHLFCVNDGKCKDDPYQGCDCPDGFRGFSCEYFVKEGSSEENINTTNVSLNLPEDPLEEISCELECNGRGTCRNGAKDTSEFDQQIYAEHLTKASNDNLEHCVCAAGYAGIECEIELETCGSSAEHMCFHGGQCIVEDETHKCDCQTATNPAAEAFGGDYCEHPATSICTTDHAGPAKALSFCVNHGTCRKMVTHTEPHPGCNCEEDWTGPHCEMKLIQNVAPAPAPTEPLPFLPQPENTEREEISDARYRKGEVVVLVMSIITLLCIAGCILKTCWTSYRQQKSSYRADAASRLRWESQYRDEPLEMNMNISPRREEGMLPPVPPSRKSIAATDDTYMGAITSAPSSRDPFAAHIAAPQQVAAPSQNSNQAELLPQLYMGPPRDEDGHILHSVEII